MSAPATPSPAPAVARPSPWRRTILRILRSLRAQCEANGDLAPLLIHHIGDGSVDSKPGEQQGCGCKQRNHFHGESPDRKRRGEHVIQCLRMEDRQLRIDGLDLPAHSARGWRRDPVAREGRWSGHWGALVGAEVDLRNAGVRQRFSASIRNHAGYRGPDWLGRAHPLSSCNRTRLPIGS